MSKHTPGPWVLSSLVVRAAGNGYEVAHVHCNFKIRGKEGRDEYEYAQGNAHLIAAAPDMLFALKAVECGAPFDVVIHQVRAAIAKAEGRK